MRGAEYGQLMTYTPIFDTRDLPSIGPLPEHLRFDMKMVLKKNVEANLANDVAAFANTAGGVILVGATEHPANSGNLSGYEPMAFADANGLGESLKKALRLCSPRPIAEAKPIELLPEFWKDEDRKFVVAVNCDPYAAPPIGVAKSGQDGGEKWWAFPARRGSHTHNLRPEELATIMEPRLRRILLLLDRIPLSPPGSVRRAMFHGRSGAVVTYDIVSIDVESSSIDIMAIDRPYRGTIPLDAITMTWRSLHDQMYHISMSGDTRRSETNILFHG